MPIPKYDDIFLPALELLSKNDILQLKEFELPLAKNFNLSESEISKTYDNKTLRIFYNRIGWALSYLSMSGLVYKPKRGYYKISENGIKLLTNSNQTQDSIINSIINKVQNKSIEQNNISDKVILNNSKELAYDLTPSEIIELYFGKIKLKVYDEILDAIISKTPREFEKLVVALLQKMGYGGEIENSGEVTQYSNDNGVDGIIKEDVLGFGRIYIQAKRYKRDNKIGREDLQKFVGALGSTQSSKGVFITTSSFNKNAIEYANKLNSSTKLVLIDGEQLAKYIYDYSVGMQTEQIIEIKKLDSDFWDIMEDEKLGF